ncbi:MAG: hypothetical protein Q8Q37_02595, partial [bacterium]|nr:hypothetical protein [bacterium]
IIVSLIGWLANDLFNRQKYTYHVRKEFLPIFEREATHLNNISKRLNREMRCLRSRSQRFWIEVFCSQTDDQLTLVESMLTASRGNPSQIRLLFEHIDKNLVFIECQMVENRFYRLN